MPTQYDVKSNLSKIVQVQNKKRSALREKGRMSERATSSPDAAFCALGLLTSCALLARALHLDDASQERRPTLSDICSRYQLSYTQVHRRAVQFYWRFVLVIVSFASLYLFVASLNVEMVIHRNGAVIAAFAYAAIAVATSAACVLALPRAWNFPDGASRWPRPSAFVLTACFVGLVGAMALALHANVILRAWMLPKVPFGAYVVFSTLNGLLSGTLLVAAIVMTEVTISAFSCPDGTSSSPTNTNKNYAQPYAKSLWPPVASVVVFVLSLSIPDPLLAVPFVALLLSNPLKIGVPGYFSVGVLLFGIAGSSLRLVVK